MIETLIVIVLVSFSILFVPFLFSYCLLQVYNAFHLSDENEEQNKENKDLYNVYK